MSRTKARRSPGGNPAARAWDPIEVVRDRRRINTSRGMGRAFVESEGHRHFFAYRNPQRAVDIAAFGNRLYDGMALTFEDGSMHLSFKRKDRSAVRDWRHFQAIKNSVAGPDREAIEIYPPEWNLIDAANEYHLWVLPPGQGSPLGLEGLGVGDPGSTLDYALYRQGGPAGARQREWEPGIPTGQELRTEGS